MGGHLIRFYKKKGIQREQGPGYSPEVKELAERHQLTMQDVALPALADSADERHGLKPLGDRFAGYALVYANNLHNAMPVSGATVGRTPHEGLLGRQATLGVFQCFGCRCWVHTPGKPFVHRRKFEPRARPGGFSGLISLLGRGSTRYYWTVGRSRSRRRSSLTTHPMCLLQCSCLKGQCSSSRDGQVCRPQGRSTVTATATAKTKCKCKGCTQSCPQCHR
jgi:hypothetical protein